MAKPRKKKAIGNSDLRVIRVSDELWSQVEADAKAAVMTTPEYVRARLARRPPPPGSVVKTIAQLRATLGALDDAAADALEQLDAVEDAVGTPMPDGTPADQ